MLHLDRLVSLGKLATAVAHEVNNPLSAILMYARLVERELPESGFAAEKQEELGRFLRQVQADASRCGDVVRNLLLFARAPEGEFAVHHMSQIIERSLALVHHHLDMARVRLETQLLAEDDAVACDAGQVQQALVALFLNAVEAMPGGGCLTVRTAAGTASVRVDISHTGASIAPEMLPRVFEPFVSTSAEASGAGLGLAAVDHIVQRHEGEIEVESAAGTGTTFRIVLPREPSGSRPSKS